MAVTDLFAGEIATELIKQLATIIRKSTLCRVSAEQLKQHIEQLLPIIQEIKYTGVELHQFRQSQLDRLSETLRSGLELSTKVLASGRWNVYKNLQLARKLERLDKQVARFMHGPMQAHVLADVHHLRFDTAERFDRLEGLTSRLETQLGKMRINGGEGAADKKHQCYSWVQDELEGIMCEENSENFGMGVEVGVRKVSEMLMQGGNGVVGITGIGGSGKTTLAKKLCKDDQVKSYFNNRILFLTVSQSPNLEELRSRIWRFLTGTEYNNCAYPVIPQWNFQYGSKSGACALVVVDDVWSLSVLEQLIFRVPGCKTLAVSRSKFPTVVNQAYEIELLNYDEAMALFCHSAFGQNFIPLSADEQLVKQLVRECKGLPLALKVVGASLRGQPQMFWTSAQNRLSRGEPIGESHEINLLERMKASLSYLPDKVKECFLDLSSFPEDTKIPLGILVNMWVETRDVDEEEAFAILIELSEKNLLSLVKDSRGADIYSSCYTIFVTQHDVLRDLAMHLANTGNINQRSRLLMPRGEVRLPKEWERNADKPFNAHIVSIHTGEMKEKDWFTMEFPKAEVLILNFSASDYFLPPFINNMPKLGALILVNHCTSLAVFHNLSVFASMFNLKSLWLERILVPHLPRKFIPSEKLQKVSLILCKFKTNFDPTLIDLPWIVPYLTELMIDHFADLVQLPISICLLRSLYSLSITNCHSLKDLPAELGMLDSLKILRVNACPSLKTLPAGICQLIWLKYLDISQCVNLVSLPEKFGRLVSLEKIDMRECSRLMTLPQSAEHLQSLKHVICDEQISSMWMKVRLSIPRLQVQVYEECFDLDWLKE